MHRRTFTAAGTAVAAVLTLTLSGCGLGGPAGKAVEAASAERTATAVPEASAAPGPATRKPDGTKSPSATASPSPAGSPSDAEALAILARVDISAATPSGGLDEAAAAKLLADPMLSLVKASWRLAKPRFRLDGPLIGTLRSPEVLRPAPAPGGDNWFAVSGRDSDGTEIFAVFRKTAAEPVWKLAMLSHVQEGLILPGIRKDKGTAETIDAAAGGSGLAADPAGTCAALIEQRGARRLEPGQWGPNLLDEESKIAEYIAEERSQGLSNELTVKPRTDAVGPVWRTTDGGALVPCVRENRWKVNVRPGYGAIVQEGKSRYLDDVPGEKITGWVDTNISMDFIHIPPSGNTVSKPDIMAGVTYPLDYSSTPAR
ncbi:hypothetical protein [Yinghuangia soli]|uniref:DUF8094 domain-containing protein n=1 Tax=Yinghuangia soli TaxID=2908204 RepID=A0AA41PVA8_9ACTN|nr:hypothetical protein [Yinghuangia soli]MCF2526267.1 hypothetical protein [Yinghuangia soli]